MRSGKIVLFACSACAAAVGCTAVEGDAYLDVVFDPCAPVAIRAPGATEAQLVLIERGLDLWRSQGVTSLALAGDAAALDDVAVLEVRFEKAAPAFHGVYEDELGVIYMNRDLTAPDAFAIAFSHELGHAFGLWHVGVDQRISVMNPGNLRIPPNDDDSQALLTLWGACDGGDRLSLDPTP